MNSDDRLPFQRLEVYVAAKALAQAIHDASIRDPELRDQATRIQAASWAHALAPTTTS